MGPTIVKIVVVYVDEVSPTLLCHGQIDMQGCHGNLKQQIEVLLLKNWDWS